MLKRLGERDVLEFEVDVVVGQDLLDDRVALEDDLAVLDFDRFVGVAQ